LPSSDGQSTEVVFRKLIDTEVLDLARGRFSVMKASWEEAEENSHLSEVKVLSALRALGDCCSLSERYEQWLRNLRAVIRATVREAAETRLRLVVEMNCTCQKMTVIAGDEVDKNERGVRGFLGLEWPRKLAFGCILSVSK
jgi:hypothetical protein